MNGQRIVLAAVLAAIVVSLGAGCSRKKDPLTMRREANATVHQIVVGVAKYAGAHDGKIAGSLAEIAPYLAGGVLPESPRAPQGFDGPGYIYVAALGGRDWVRLDSPNTYVIVYENPLYCTDGIAVGFVDGHNEWLTMRRFRTVLEETYKRLGVPIPE